MTPLFLYLSMCLIGMASAAFSADTDRDGLPDDWETANERNKANGYCYSDLIRVEK